MNEAYFRRLTQGSFIKLPKVIKLTNRVQYNLKYCQ